MPAFICTTCGCQYPNTEGAPAFCLICQDDRQYVNPAGQTWTTLPAMRKTYFNAFRRLEPGLMGIGTFPAFAIGQRALLLRTPAGNVLWDCISFLDDTTITIIKALGGLAGIACSHPHFLASVVEWSHAFESVPVYVHAMDRKYVTRLDPVVTFWEGDRQELTEGITLVRCGGHFAGSTALHWAAGADGRGALLTADTLTVASDTRYVSFMYSYPNLIPLPKSAIEQIVRSVEPFAVDRIYGGWWERVVSGDAKAAVARSAERYIRAIGH
jgi:glyoxylase-like metal-dependent hydrolase (beta-lactamase superfamily II)